MPSSKEPTIRVVMLPKDTNSAGTIFGGIILSHLDLAGSVEAGKHARSRFVTVAMREVEFIAPVYVGDVVSFYTQTLKIGRTSITARVEVQAERIETGEKVKVTEAEVVYVSVDDSGRPKPIKEEES